MISVIIPTLNDAAALRRCLDHLSPHRAHLEVIVADGGSDDGTQEVLADFSWVHFTSSVPGRGHQINAGCKKASHEILLFLHTDTILSGNWPPVVEQAAKKPGFGFGAFHFAVDHPSPKFRLLELAVLLRNTFRKLPYGDQAVFTTRKNLQGIGGCPELPLMEDVEMVLKLQWRGHFSLIKLSAQTSARRWLKKGFLKQSLLNRRLVRAYLRGANAQDLYTAYEQQPHDHVAVYCKYPDPGQVKTRLGRDIGMEKAAGIYRALAEKTLKQLRGIRPVYAWYSPAEKRSDFVRWMGEDIHFIRQEGQDLGARLKHTVRRHLQHADDRLVIVGTDCPLLTSAHIKLAFDALETHDVVVGPTDDGGYYLIGLSKPHDLLFDGISWSTARVFEQTLGIADSHNLSVYQLEKLRDLDDEEDLRYFLKIPGCLENAEELWTVLS